MPSDFLQSLGPDSLSQILALGGLDEQQSMLDQQLQQALALRQPGPVHRSALGGAFGALADGLNAYTSQRDQNAIRHQMHGIMDQQTAARQALGRAYFNAQQPPMALPPPPPQPIPPPPQQPVPPAPGASLPAAPFTFN